MLPPSKPFTRTMQKHEKEALQKWVQCARCNQWRKVGWLGLIVISKASPHAQPKCAGRSLALQSALQTEMS